MSINHQRVRKAKKRKELYGRWRGEERDRGGRERKRKREERELSVHVGEDPKVMRRQGREGISRQSEKQEEESILLWGHTVGSREEKVLWICNMWSLGGPTSRPCGPASLLFAWHIHQAVPSSLPHD